MEKEVLSTITWYEIAAIIGALSWLPHIVKILKEYLSKSEITILLPKSAELGFTMLGNIFNTKIAFATKNKDIVISEIGIKVTYENGSEKYLSWQGITQRLAEFVKDNTTLPMEKNQTVLAIKLNQKDIEERFIRFQDNSFLQNKDEMEITLLKKLANMEKSGNLKDFSSSDEFLDLISFISHSLFWKAGKYKILFTIKSPEKFILKDYNYSFELTHVDIDNLEKNKKSIEKFVESIGQARDNPNYKFEEIKWNWVYPTIKKVS